MRSSPGVLVWTMNPASSSVSRTSWPLSTSGPVPIEVQKQVDADVVQLTAMTSAFRRRAR
jgi:hypothetical protein